LLQKNVKKLTTSLTPTQRPPNYFRKYPRKIATFLQIKKKISTMFVRVFCYYLFNLVWLYLNLFNLKKFGISNKNDYLYNVNKTQNDLNFTIMKATEKKQLVAQLIKKYVQNGYPIENFKGKPLSYFDEEKVKAILENKYFFKC